MKTVMIMMMRTVVIKWMIARNGDLEDEREKKEEWKEKERWNGVREGWKERVCKCDGCQ